MKKLNIFLIVFSFLILATLSCFVQALNINIIEGKTYNSTHIIFNLSSSEKTDFFYIVEKSSGNWIRICQDKKECYKSLNMKEGLNSIIIKTLDDNGFGEEKKVSFVVDSKRPEILRISPPSNSIVNGSSFSIEYSEDHLKEIRLNYGYPNNMKNLTKNNCNNRSNQKCNFSMDISNLSGFDGKLIDFWFSLSDAVSTVNSKRMRVNVDTSAPNVSYSNYSIMKNKITFVFDINERNFKDITYKDINDCSMKSEINGVLCKSLVNGRCIAIKEVCSGNHNISVTVRDKTGNTKVLDPIIVNI